MMSAQGVVSQGEEDTVDSGRGSGPDRPVEPDEARAHGNDPDAVEIRNGGTGGSEGDGPRRVGEVREDREGEGAQGSTEGAGTWRAAAPGPHRRTRGAGARGGGGGRGGAGRTGGDEHLRDRDAGTNRATSEAGAAAAADVQE